MEKLDFVLFPKSQPKPRLPEKDIDRVFSFEKHCNYAMKQKRDRRKTKWKGLVDSPFAVDAYGRKA